jgi:hypothetical protein
LLQKKIGSSQSFLTARVHSKEFLERDEEEWNKIVILGMMENRNLDSTAYLKSLPVTTGLSLKVNQGY